MNKTFSREKTLRMVQIALLSAIVVILQVFFSNIQIGPVTLSFTLVPIVIASVFVSPLAGLIVGLVSGVTTVIQVFTSANPFYVFLVTINPAVTVLICLVKTSIAGFLSGLVYQILSVKRKILGVILSSAICPIVNTGIFCIGMLTFFGNALQADPTFGSDASASLITFVFVGLAGINFVFEFLLNVILCPALYKALASTSFFRKKKK